MSAKNIETSYFRTQRGYQGESSIELGNQRVLGIRTSKYMSSGRLMTIASVYRDYGNGAISHIMFNDYHKTCAVSDVRVTEKAVQRQHESVLAKLEEILADVTAHYAASEAKAECA